jgi:hypothetical protein
MDRLRKTGLASGLVPSQNDLEIKDELQIFSSSCGWREFQSLDLVVSFVNMESVAATSGENENRANSGTRSVKILRAHRPLPHR